METTTVKTTSPKTEKSKKEIKKINKRIESMKKKELKGLCRILFTLIENNQLEKFPKVKNMLTEKKKD